VPIKLVENSLLPL